MKPNATERNSDRSRGGKSKNEKSREKYEKTKSPSTSGMASDAPLRLDEASLRRDPAEVFDLLEKLGEGCVWSALLLAR
jgi:hypothetical protein